MKPRVPFVTALAIPEPGRFGLRPSGPGLPVLLCICFTLIALTARSQYSIDWFTVDGGGDMNGTGGTFTLSGTIGQPDAGILGGGRLVGGFWGLVAPVPPVLSISRLGNNVFISWPSPSTGFVLQQNSSLSTPFWSDVLLVPSDNGTSKSVTTLASSSATFYRLRNP